MAPVHRHTPNASRTILSANGGYTTIEGERCEAARGDLIFTPNGTWHDHGNDGCRARDLGRHPRLAAARISRLRLARRRIPRARAKAIRAPRRSARGPAIRSGSTPAGGIVPSFVPHQRGSGMAARRCCITAASDIRARSTGCAARRAIPTRRSGCASSIPRPAPRSSRRSTIPRSCCAPARTTRLEARDREHALFAHRRLGRDRGRGPAPRLGRRTISSSCPISPWRRHCQCRHRRRRPLRRLRRAADATRSGNTAPRAGSPTAASSSWSPDPHPGHGMAAIELRRLRPDEAAGYRELRLAALRSEPRRLCRNFCRGMRPGRSSGSPSDCRPARSSPPSPRANWSASPAFWSRRVPSSRTRAACWGCMCGPRRGAAGSAAAWSRPSSSMRGGMSNCCS